MLLYLNVVSNNVLATIPSKHTLEASSMTLKKLRKSYFSIMIAGVLESCIITSLKFQRVSARSIFILFLAVNSMHILSR